MTSFTPRLLTPPREKEDIYPYRRVWRSIILEGGILIAIAAGLFLTSGFITDLIPVQFEPVLRIALALTPLVLWLIFSWWAEQRVMQPRARLIAVAVIGALAANAVGEPLINQFFQVEDWLPLSSAIDRIVGYTFTVGITQEFLKYLVVRYVAWPDHFRIRLDGVAYGVAVSIGYVTVLNLHLLVNTPVALDVAAQRVVATYAIQIATSVVIGYGLSEVRFSDPNPLFLALMLALAALITGIAIPIRAGLTNAAFSLEGVFPRPLFGFGFSAVLLVIPIFVGSFLFASAERRAQEAMSDMEDSI
ncbi:MAG: PrsW family intramembrane metalloprotease [Anaerolineae bacterium]|nr:PrsW family intramembrane metalloprotease [Anaerolineae bacterium]